MDTTNGVNPINRRSVPHMTGQFNPSLPIPPQMAGPMHPYYQPMYFPVPMPTPTAASSDSNSSKITELVGTVNRLTQTIELMKIKMDGLSFKLSSLGLTGDDTNRKLVTLTNKMDDLLKKADRKNKPKKPPRPDTTTKYAKLSKPLFRPKIPPPTRPPPPKRPELDGIVIMGDFKPPAKNTTSTGTNPFNPIPFQSFLEKLRSKGKSGRPPIEMKPPETEDDEEEEVEPTEEDDKMVEEINFNVENINDLIHIGKAFTTLKDATNKKSLQQILDEAKPPVKDSNPPKIDDLTPSNSKVAETERDTKDEEDDDHDGNNDKDEVNDPKVIVVDTDSDDDSDDDIPPATTGGGGSSGAQGNGDTNDKDADVTCDDAESDDATKSQTEDKNDGDNSGNESDGNKQTDEKRDESNDDAAEKEKKNAINSVKKLPPIKPKTAVVSTLKKFGLPNNHIKKICKREIVVGHPPNSNSKPQPKKRKNSPYFELLGKTYSINLETINKLIKPLTKLKEMIGMKMVKESVVDQIMYYIQKLDGKNKNMLHTVIEGPPGVGKTELGKILAEIFAALGIIKSNKIKFVKRTDLIGEYLGHTAHRTKEAIEEADGGVLFIDEAYSLGNSEKKDSFAKEAIDTLNQYLSEKRANIICIIAGYPEELDKCFFSYNPGLRRRFPFVHRIDPYDATELADIFIKKVGDMRWKVREEEIDRDHLINFFVDNYDKFPHFGGDIENLLTNCKYCHSRRVFLKKVSKRKVLTEDDIKNGLKRFVKYGKKPSDEEVEDKRMREYLHSTLYS